MPQSKEFHGLIRVVSRFSRVLYVLNLVLAHLIWSPQPMYWKRLWRGDSQTPSLCWSWLHLCCIPTVTRFWDLMNLWLLSHSLVIRLYHACDHPCCPAHSSSQSTLSFQRQWDWNYTQYSRQTNKPFIQWHNNILSFILFPFLVISNTNFFTVSEQWADVFTELPIVTPRSQSWSSNSHLGAHRFV